MTEQLTDIWHDRRVNIGYETAEELAHKFNDSNWRAHPESQADALDDSLETLHWIGSVKVNIQTGRMFDGHLRVKRALVKNPSMPIPVDYYDLSPEEEDLALAVHDAITEQAEPIADKLASLLERTREMTADRPGLGAMLAALQERAGINGHQPKEDAGPQIDKAAELQKVWGVRVGDVWELGQHRLACGDCTDRATVEAVMNGERHNLMTDPPYGIGAANMTMGSKQSSLPKNARLSNVDNWDSQAVDVIPFVNGAEFSCVWGAQYLALGLPVSDDWLCWDKKNPNLSFSEFELAWTNFGTRCRVLSHHWGVEAKQHITQKPLPVIAWALSLCPDDGLTIFDPFLGSGTTMVAAHQLNRRCFGIEIEPSYVAVTLERMSNLGQTPRRVSG